MSLRFQPDLPIQLMAARIGLNIPVRDVANGQEVWDASEGSAYIGFLAKQYVDVTNLAEDMALARANGMAVSAGLGEGDPGQWRKVVEAARVAHPHHVNMPFPLASLAVGLLRYGGIVSKESVSGPLVNALIRAAPDPGMVIISTGPESSRRMPAVVPVDTAVEMAVEQGICALKYMPAGKADGRKGAKRLALSAAQARIAVEPSGGIDLGNILSVLTPFLEAGVRVVIPHIHTALLEPGKGRTSPRQVEKLLAILRCL